MFITSNCSELCPILVDQLVNIITEKANGGHTVGEAKNGGVYLVEGKIHRFAHTHPSGCFGTFP